jgi:DNA excision repair protein ERCC-3
LVAKDTDEVQFSAKRRRFLVDQGYEFHVISDYTKLIPLAERASLHYYTERDQQELLYTVKQQDDTVGLDEELEVGIDDLAAEMGIGKKRSLMNAAAKREKVEENKSKKRSTMFKSWDRGR